MQMEYSHSPERPCQIRYARLQHCIRQKVRSSRHKLSLQIPTIYTPRTERVAISGSRSRRVSRAGHNVEVVKLLQSVIRVRCSMIHEADVT